MKSIWNGFLENGRPQRAAGPPFRPAGLNQSQKKSGSTYERGVFESGLEIVRRLDQVHFVLVLVQGQDGARILLALRQRLDDGDVETDVPLDVVDQPADDRLFFCVFVFIKYASAPTVQTYDYRVILKCEVIIDQPYFITGSSSMNLAGF